MRRITLVFATIGLASVSVAGRHAATSPQAPLVFKTGVDYVSVDAIVTDSDDRPITDLTKNDFAIIEHGKEQTIADFRHVSIPVAHRTIDLDQPPAPEPDVTTNEPPTPNSRLFVMVVDDLHILPENIVSAQRVMTDFLRAMSPGDEVAMVFVGRSDLSQDFTTDVGRLLRVVSHVKEAFGFGLGTLDQLSGMASSPRLQAPCSPMMLNNQSASIVPRGLSAARSAGWELKNVAAALATSGHPRRAIVFVSDGVSLDPMAPAGSNCIYDLAAIASGSERHAADEVYRELQDAFAAARRADVPIYTLDPRGGGAELATGEELRRVRIEHSYLATIAINTGGRAIFNRNDLTGAINDIVAENGSFYLLGYYPQPFVRDGAFHELSVKVTRPAGRRRAVRSPSRLDRWSVAPPAALSPPCRSKTDWQ